MRVSLKRKEGDPLDLRFRINRLIRHLRGAKKKRGVDRASLV